MVRVELFSALAKIKLDCLQFLNTEMVIFMKSYENNINFHEYADMEIVNGECIHSFPVHIHENLCIGLITSGRVEFVMNGYKEILSIGDNYVIPPYTPHKLSSVGYEKFCYSVICFKDSAVPKRFNTVISDAKAFIETTASEFNIDALATAVHVSKYHLDRIFKKQVGTTPYQFYIDYRVKLAKQGLQAKLSLSDIVSDLHFSDQSHLCNTFRKHVGISPTQYVRSYKNFITAEV